jgi:Ca-activated chloride channel family protein
MTIFAQPSALLLLLVLPALWFIMRNADLERRSAIARFGNPGVLGKSSRLPAAHSVWRQALWWIALTGTVFALARPQIGKQPSTAPRAGRDLIVALDLSRSMLAEDVGASRLRRAKELAWRLASARPGDRIGMVIFGGAAFLQLPPTTDLGTFQMFLEAASPDDVADPATDLAAALRVSERALRKERALIGSRAVILVTDGERSEGSLDPVLDLYRRARVPVFSIGVGTAEGARLPADSGSGTPWHLDGIGRPVVSRLAEDDLLKIGAATNGGYARWDDRVALDAVGQALANLEARTVGTQPSTEPIERYQWPLAIAVAALLVEMLLGQMGGTGQARRTGRAGRAGRAVTTTPIAPIASHAPVSSALSLLSVVSLLSCTGQRDLTRGQQLYEAGKYLDAYEAYQRVLVQQGGVGVKYNAGNALYRMKQYNEANKQWWEALSGPPELRQHVYYNMGNAFVRAAEDANALSRYLDKAITAYEEALRLNPEDKDAKWNLEIALQRRGDTDQRGSRGRGGRADYGKGNNEEGYDGSRETAVGAMAGGGSGGDEGESVEELDAEQARAMLEAVERQQLSTHEARRQKQGGGADRDW